MIVQYCCDSGSTNKLMNANEVILSAWLCWMTMEGARLLKLYSSASVASWMSHHENNQTAVSYSSQFTTKQKQIQVWQLLYLS